VRRFYGLLALYLLRVDARRIVLQRRFANVRVRGAYRVPDDDFDDGDNDVYHDSVNDDDFTGDDDIECVACIVVVCV